MGKMKPAKRSSALRPTGQQKTPLADEIESLKLAKAPKTAATMTSGSGTTPYSRSTATNNNNNNDEEDDMSHRVVDSRITAKILNEARRQQNELQDECEEGEENNNGGSSQFKKFQSNFIEQQKIRRVNDDSSDSDTDNDVTVRQHMNESYSDEEVEITEEDERAFAKFMGEPQARSGSGGVTARRTIADIIMEKLTEKKTELASEILGGDDRMSMQQQPELDERVVKMYTQIKEILARYRSGKLPKAFKILPSLANWEHILYLTDPDGWSAAAVYQATRIFASNLNAKMAQRFYSLVLLPRIRDDIAEYKRLNFHLYMALRKALFKPAAFFKGVLLPLCESRTCTLREAIVIGSVLAKNSIPMLHSAAALLKIAEMEYSGANSIFLRILLDKKYALPYRVIDAVVNHFTRFQMDSRELPVLWHQSLLTFVQRYKSDISSEQKEALLELLKKHAHQEITPEIRRELMNAKCRDLEINEDANSQHSVDLNFNDD